ncbi:MAG: S8 family serine peptidase [Chloroflexota bacterium]|nr:S8 family serine peptidase [Chloroflexota bacterium]
MQPHFRSRAARIAALIALLVSVLSFGGQVYGQDAPRLNFTLPESVAPTSERSSGDAPRIEAPMSIPTETWAVQLQPGANADTLAARLGYVNQGQIANLPDTYLFVIPNTGLRMDELVGETVASLSERVTPRTNGRAVEIASAALRTASEIVWYEHQYAHDGYTRVPTDPLYPNQWHLNHTGQVAGAAGNDANVLPAWNAGYDGTGVNISIVDEGMQHTHPDLAPNYLPSASFDWNQNDTDPSPTSSGEGHGTAAGGVAAGSDDGVSCGVGAAYNAGLSSQRILAGLLTDTIEANGLGNQRNVNHIYNNSWGPSDSGTVLDEPGALVKSVFANNTASGRSGLGSIFVWANGNGYQSGDYAGADGYTSSRYVIAVAATDSAGVSSYYNEGGSAVLVNAPSNGNANGITTTDLTGSGGYSATNCTSTFGGTSSASPLTAGVVALMLDANPNLTWRDVQHILVNTSDRTDTGNTNWRKNASGRWISEYYGFGRVDADEATRRALGWTTVPAEQNYTSPVINVNQPIADGAPNTYTQSAHAVGTAMRFTEHVEVVFNATHTWRGDLRVLLTAPSGTISTLMIARSNDSGDNYSNWTFTSAHFWGEDPNGTWTISVSDAFTTDVGTFNNWQIKVYGTTADPLNRITNGAFNVNIGSAETNWGVFGAPGSTDANIGYNWTGSAFDFHRKVNGDNSAAVLQYTRLPIQDGAVVQVDFQAQNTGPDRRRMTVIAWDEDFGDLRTCTFWIPGNSALNTYALRFKTSRAWTGALLHFYASTANASGNYRIDNVSLRLNRTTTSAATLCVDPLLPASGGGADGTNALVNASFAAPIGSANGNWGLFPGAGIIWEQTAGVFYYRRPAALASAVVLQNTALPVGTGGRLEATFQLGNNTGSTQRVTILLHASDFSDLTVCTFYVPNGAPLQTYTIRSYATQAWGTASISFYLSSTATGGYVSLDNASLRIRPGIALTGTECYPAGVTPADVLPFEDVRIIPTLEATATGLPYAAPGMTGELPIVATAAPLPETTTGEGTSSE